MLKKNCIICNQIHFWILGSKIVISNVLLSNPPKGSWPMLKMSFILNGTLFYKNPLKDHKNVKNMAEKKSGFIPLLVRIVYNRKTKKLGIKK